MAAREIDTFVQKFKYLWCAGLDAHLNVETNAGQAWVSLHLRLGHPPGPLHVPPKQTRNSPAQQRRRERREVERNQKAEKAKDATEMDEEVPEVIEVEKAPTKPVENAAQAVEAENATIQESSSKVAEEASSENVKCDLCDSEFQNSRGLRAHKGRLHKNIIPQVDGFSEELDNDCEYTFESNYGEEDIEYTIVELLSDKIPSKLVSRVKIGSNRSANHLCTVRVSPPRDGWQWPAMNQLQAEVMQHVKRSHSCC